MKTLRLKTSIIHFRKTVRPLQKELDKLDKRTFSSQAERERVLNDVLSWKEKFESVLKANFKNHSSIWRSYLGILGYIGPNRYDIGTDKDVTELTNWKLRTQIGDAQRELNQIVKILPALDLVVGNEPLINPSNHSIDDILYLILYKLRELKNGEYYELNWILEGNGIFLTRGSTELFEIKEALRGLIEAHSDSARITVKGEIQLAKWERARLRASRTLNKSTIDDLIKELKKLGLGQEILFDELQDLKQMNSKLNKKQWKQMVLGKLVDLTMNEVIDSETAQRIFGRILPNERLGAMLTQAS